MKIRPLTPVLRETLRKEILVIAYNASPQAVTVRIFETYLEPLGLQQTQQELEQQIAYLMDKGLLKAAPKMISPENRAWTVTAEGTDYLATHGLI